MICELQEGTHNDIKESNHNRYKIKIARELEVDRRTVASPFLIMYYAEEQYFIKQYKKNKVAFEDVKMSYCLFWMKRM